LEKMPVCPYCLSEHDQDGNEIQESIYIKKANQLTEEVNGIIENIQEKDIKNEKIIPDPVPQDRQKIKKKKFFELIL